MAAAVPHIHVFDDRDLDDAELWAVIDSAAAARSSSRSRRPLLALQSGAPSVSPLPGASPVPGKLTSRSPSSRVRVEEVRGPADGEVLQEEQWSHRRPPKMARFVDHRAYGGDQMVRVRHPPQSPTVTSPSASPDAGMFPVHGVNPVVEVTRLDFCQGEEKENQHHSLSGRFPSVSLFKQYHNAAMSILEKGDYTIVSGNPFIKKSGWRKIALFFNISFEIKDKTIEFDENRNVMRAEFVVRAFMRGGRFSDGWGSCEHREKRFCKPNHDIPSTAETRAKNKACQSNGSFFHDAITTLGSLIGITTLLEELSGGSFRRRRPVQQQQSGRNRKSIRKKSTSRFFISLCARGRIKNEAAANGGAGKMPSLGQFLESEKKASGANVGKRVSIMYERSAEPRRSQPVPEPNTLSPQCGGAKDACMGWEGLGGEPQ